MISRLFATLFLAIALVASPAIAAEGKHPEARPYGELVEEADARAALSDARVQAAAEGKLVMAVFGANWCHDSRGFAGLMETERFQALIDQHYVVVFINVGRPQNGNGRNLDLAAELGVTDIEGTPNVIVIGRDGETLNADTARTWRDAASREADAIYDELLGFAEESP